MEKKKNNYSLAITGIKDMCTGCGACANICPVNAIDMAYDEEGFYCPVVDVNLCIGCLKCERHCHVLSLERKDGSLSFAPYMCWAKDEDLRYKSTSGGVFSLLADAILVKGGVVFGARYNFEKERLEHNHTDNFDLSEFRKSKYAESTTLNTFTEVKAFLSSGRYVLYCGTPCQIVGLKTFLTGTNVSKLVLVDFICHGVPSCKHFFDYIKHLERKFSDKVKSFDFRPKEKMSGWRVANVHINMQKGRVLDVLHYEDLYARPFQENLLLRKSCYKCSITQLHEADLTLGDFWGIRRYKPEIDDDCGISLVVVNSAKGEKAFGAIEESKMESEKLPVSAVTYAYKPREEMRYDLKKRAVIAEEVKEKEFVKVMIRKYGRDIFCRKVKRNVRRMVKIALRIK